MPDTPAQDRPPEKVLISPRYLAASLPTTHHHFLDIFAEETGWSATTDNSSLTVNSPCRRVTIRHDETAAGLRPHLVISARSDEDAAERWRTSVSGAVPVEFVATLLGTLAAELEADPDHVVYGIGTEPGPFELLVDIDAWSPFDASGLSGFISRDGQAAVIGRPQDSPAPPIHGDAAIAWHVAASPDDLGHLWDISFTQQAPDFLMHAVVAKTLDPRPILRSTAFPFPKAVVPLVNIQHVPSPRPPAARPSPAEPARSLEPKRTPKTR
ncbi:hypothetical protein SLNWT_1326 [Streptomyces albus]|uniref:DUF317 domain-containing protein n=1 Tax=Streptomyces albus (strain ATCC 21838 / DSM 41398 / FERM P-419 / JCM 4703 / NBRC 107858) TaxID=1081613 RepID=A0A0B5EUB0_STRA4|nr:hypothetical protein SLNWT_1326 [Streptomyces albus]AOU76018.1 hypothetical protein SLNHY_1327 [Streptomyces albus]AYN31817.1 DUF317 domain-containing protein [Streptomyces albus]